MEGGEEMTPREELEKALKKMKEAPVSIYKGNCGCCDEEQYGAVVIMWGEIWRKNCWLNRSVEVWGIVRKAAKK